MLSALRPRPWVCRSCLVQRAAPIRQRRWLTSAETAGATRPLEFPNLAAVRTSEKPEQTDFLRHIFDSPQAWKSFNNGASGKNAGLFRNRYLTGPQGFIEFAHVNLERARAIVDKVLGASTRDEYRAIVRDLDRLSDILCRVLDMADFVRVTHPDNKTQRAASDAWEMVYTYMNELNTMTGLNDQLGRAMADRQVTATWSDEEKMVAEVLKLDFAKSAVNLPKSARDRFVRLSSDISRVGSEFVQHMAPEVPFLVLPSSKMMGMSPVEASRLTKGGNIYLPTLSGEATMALRTVHDEATRKRIYYVSRTASKRSVQQLEELMTLRAELAKLSGFESYGHLALRDRMMAKTPEAVVEFLQALTENVSPRVKLECNQLLEQKKAHRPGATWLEPWDKEYYAEMVRRTQNPTAQRYDDALSAYFSLGTVIQGISSLLTRLYGIKLVPRPTSPGETWDPDVRRLDVVSDTDGHIAVLYCDLFYRPSKSPNPAHFTLRCSREISDAELAEFHSAPDPELAATDGMAYSRSGRGTMKQLPTIALVCDFQQAPAHHRGRAPPTLLSFFQLETLFHEMGHAVHSLLARTSFQNVSGTRCATDLAELPSTLMEYFAANPAVLALFACHHETGEPLPYGLLAEKLAQARAFEASDTENQIVLAMLDQRLHSSLALEPGFDSTAVFHGLQRQFGSAPPDPKGTRWQGFFGHLSGYGSTYYSYLFDRVLAQRVWNVVFKGGEGAEAVQRENGERLKEGLLKWGGGRDAWECMADVLRDERLEGGGERAMALVGSWGASSSTGSV
ncbi:mitochondrial intermediate peptidase [Podospora conica]|nr:mitochondrial intermediate peptidase [Schizothecium conicum]